MSCQYTESRGYAAKEVFAEFAQDVDESFTTNVGKRALYSHGNFAAYKRLAEGRYALLTDHAGTLPIYYGTKNTSVAVGWNAIGVAKKLAAPLDLASVADFLINGTVCFPYTLFSGVFVAPPGAVSLLSSTGIKEFGYYRPEETVSRLSADEWAYQLARTLREALVFGIEGCERITLLFSGGLDSRIIASLLPNERVAQLVTVSGSENREVRLAAGAAEALGRRMTFIERRNGHYFELLSERVDLVGGLFDVAHTHIHGELASQLVGSDAIVGAYMADTLFKTLWMENVTSSRSLLPQRLKPFYPVKPVGIANVDSCQWLTRHYSEEVFARRLSHHDKLRQFRPTSAGNWHNRWPLGTQQPHYAHYLACQRIGPRIVEPFLDCQSYRLAAKLPDELRLDHKVLREAFRETLGRAGWRLTSSGTFPNCGGLAGHLLSLLVRGAWKLQKTARPWAGLRELEEGAWNSDREYETVKGMDLLSAGELTALEVLLDDIAAPRNGSHSVLSELTAAQAFRAVQIGKVLSHV